jgi:hypothetical protein
MNRRYSALALSTFAMGAVVLSTPQASAMLKDPDRGFAAAPTSPSDWPDEGSGYPSSEATHCTYPEDPACNVPPLKAIAAASTSRYSGLEGAQLGASALGGAGVALGGIWLYHRRYPLAG